MVNHDQVPETALDHGHRRVLQRPVRMSEGDLGGQVLGHPLGVRVLAGRHRAQDVPLSDQPGAHRLRVEHDRGPHPAFGHGRGSFAQRVARPDGQNDL